MDKRIKGEKGMKKLVLILSIISATSVSSADIIKNVHNSKINSPTTVNVTVKKKVINKTVNKKFVKEINVTEHVTEDKKKFEVGVGADVTLYEDEGALVEKVTEEYRYDWANSDHQAYTVVHFNLWQKVRSLFKKDPPYGGEVTEAAE